MGLTFNGTRGPYTAGAAPATLASLIGYWPATLNMCDWVGSDGKTLYGAHTDFTQANVQSNGNPFWNAGGANPGGHATAAFVTSPLSFDGTPVVQTLTEDTSTGTHSVALAASVLHDFAIYHPIPMRMMCIAKAHQRTRIVYQFTTPFQAVTANATAGFDLAGGNTSYGNSSSANITIIATSMINLGGGYWACILDWQWNTGTTGLGNPGDGGYAPEIILDNGSGTAANSTSYTGDGASGVYIVMASLLPKALWSNSILQNNVFNEDFNNLNNVDVNATNGPGFNFWANQQFPNGVPGAAQGFPAWWNNNGSMPPTPAATFSMYAPSVMKMQAPHTFPGGNFNTSLQSVNYTSGTGLASLQGHYWAPPLVMDGWMAMDTPTMAEVWVNALNNLAFWSATAETLAGSPLDPNMEYLELDMNDIASGGSQLVNGAVAAILWKGTTGTTEYQVNFPGVPVNGPSTYRNRTPNLSIFFRSTIAWVDSTSGHSGASGYGFIMGFNNGKGLGGNSLCVYGSAIAPKPPGTGTVGLMTSIDSQHSMMFLWSPGLITGATTPAPVSLWDWVRVWQ